MTVENQFHGTEQSWQIETLWGIDYDSISRGEPMFKYPFGIQLTSRGSVLVVDRGLPYNRVVEVFFDGRRKVLFACAPRLAFAHLNDDGSLYVVVNNELLLVRNGLSSSIVVVKGMNYANCGTIAGDMIAIGGEEGIYIYTLTGSRLAHIPASENTIVEPVDIEWLPDGYFLVSERWACCVSVLSEEGEVVKRLGRWRQPGIDDDGFGGPLSASKMVDGRILVADWQSHNVFLYDNDGNRHCIVPPCGNEFFGPSFVRAVSDSRFVVAETGARRVSMRSLKGSILWCEGDKRTPIRSFSFPRSVEPAGKNVLVCDSYSDRVVLVDLQGRELQAIGRSCERGGDIGLSAPRAAAYSADGHVAIADGLNGRIVVLDEELRLQREITMLRMGGNIIPLGDPHHVQPLGGGVYLLVDSDLGIVVIVEEDGSVLQSWGSNGMDLADPHHAVLLSQSSLLISDSANNRVILADRNDEIIWSISVLNDGSVLNYPRCARVLKDAIAIADSGSSRLVIVNCGGELMDVVGPLIDVGDNPQATPELRVPKWLQILQGGKLFVADYYNSRIIGLRRVENTGH